MIALSTSGETEEVIRMLNYIKRLGIKLISLVGNPDSTLARQSDVFIDCSVEKEACPIGLVPSASSTLTLAVGDALSIALMEKRGFSEEDFRFYPPRRPDRQEAAQGQAPDAQGRADAGRGRPGALMKDVIRIINEKKFGVAIVVRDRDRGGRHHHRRRPAPPVPEGDRFCQNPGLGLHDRRPAVHR